MYLMYSGTGRVCVSAGSRTVRFPLRWSNALIELYCSHQSDLPILTNLSDLWAQEDHSALRADATGVDGLPLQGVYICIAYLYSWPLSHSDYS